MSLLADWGAVATTLTLKEWLKLWDIDSELYRNKMDMAINRDDLHRQFGKPMPSIIKVDGSLMVLALIGILFAPLFIVSIGNQLDNEPYKPYEAVMHVSLAPSNSYKDHADDMSAVSSFKLFQSTAVPFDVSDSRFDALADCNLVENFPQKAVQAVSFRYTDSYWTIPAPVRQSLVGLLNASALSTSTDGDANADAIESGDPSSVAWRPTWQLRADFEFRRRFVNDEFPLTIRQNLVAIPLGAADLGALRDMIAAPDGTPAAAVDGLDLSNIPRVFHIEKLAAVASQPYIDHTKAGSLHRSSARQFGVSGTGTGTAPAEAWVLRKLPRDDCSGMPTGEEENDSGSTNKRGDGGDFDEPLTFVLLCSAVANTTFFAYIAGLGGLIGLYISGVLVVGKFLSLYFQRISHRIVFEDLPQVTSLTNLVYTIHVCRELASSSSKKDARSGGGGGDDDDGTGGGDAARYPLAYLQQSMNLQEGGGNPLELEERLFRLLIRIYRNPQAMMRWSNINLLHRYNSKVLAERQTLYWVQPLALRDAQDRIQVETGDLRAFHDLRQQSSYDDRLQRGTSSQFSLGGSSVSDDQAPRPAPPPRRALKRTGFGRRQPRGGGHAAVRTTTEI